jgi:hypothetical protein
VFTQLAQIAKKAKLDRQVRFTSVAHMLTPEFLKETWGTMNRRGASGIDGESTQQFESGLEQRVEEICVRLKAGAYRAPPVRRVENTQGAGEDRDLSVRNSDVEDRLLHRAVARTFEAIFEADFCDSSCRFRPGRNPHHALHALRVDRDQEGQPCVRGGYPFDRWTREHHADIPFERYADDAICRCRSEAEARATRRIRGAVCGPASCNRIHKRRRSFTARTLSDVAATRCRDSTSWASYFPAQKSDASAE